MLVELISNKKKHLKWKPCNSISLTRGRLNVWASSAKNFLKARLFYGFVLILCSSLDLLLSGKLSGFTQENNTIDSGELDIGRRAIQEVPPGVFWRSQLFIDQPQFLKFNISLQKDALIGVYGRKGLPPSHTQVKVGLVVSRRKTASLHFWS